MVRPISLSVHRAAVTVRARKLLRELDEKDKQQRRKWQATKAMISIREMTALISPADRDLCRADFERAKAFLEKIRDRGGG